MSTSPSRPGVVLGLAVVLGLSAAGLTWLTQRITCAVAPGVPLLNAGCDMDTGFLALVIGGGAAVVGAVGLLLAERRR